MSSSFWPPQHVAASASTRQHDTRPLVCCTRIYQEVHARNQFRIPRVSRPASFLTTLVLPGHHRHSPDLYLLPRLLGKDYSLFWLS
ncbi:hypothetical protein E2C01_020631 [Portunus trituberculatus]|uniref:Uncharacterized protein n=1 Tax=Portunus trituberculatus TaxID=210409 RepID=A0A5B7E0E6_PORTR|nr:hypothetical protein [Portunus trituberculatus]